MRVDPGFHPLNLIEVFVPEFPAVKFFLSAARFLGADLILPGRGEDEIDLRERFALMRYRPLVRIVAIPHLRLAPLPDHFQIELASRARRHATEDTGVGGKR